MQPEASLEYFPAGQSVQAVIDVASVVDVSTVFPGGQLKQTAVPPGENLLTAQSTQTPAVLVFPAGQ